MPDKNSTILFPERYRLISQIGSGGTGTVHLVYDSARKENVALKVLKNATDKNQTERFIKEFRILKRLRHRYIAEIYDFGFLSDGSPFFALEFVSGKPINSWFSGLVSKQGKSEESVLKKICFQVLSALDYVHNRGILHGDIKPDNILVKAETETGFEIKILDFGFSKFMTGTNQSEGGTIGYIAPEKLVRKNYDERSDLYSLAIILLELCLNKNYFEGKSTAEIYNYHLTHHFEIPDSVYRQFPTIAALTHKLLDKNPAKRLQTAQEVMEFLDPDFQHFISPASGPAANQFIGYRKEFEKIDRYFSSDANYLYIKILGAKQSGKTRFLQQLSADIKLNSGLQFFIDCGLFQSSATRFNSELKMQMIQKMNELFFRKEELKNNQEASTLFNALESKDNLNIPELFSVLVQYSPIVLLLDDYSEKNTAVYHFLEQLHFYMVSLSDQRHKFIVVLAENKTIPDSLPFFKSAKVETIELNGWDGPEISEYLVSMFGNSILNSTGLSEKIDKSAGNMPGNIVRLVESIRKKYPHLFLSDNKQLESQLIVRVESVSLEILDSELDSVSNESVKLLSVLNEVGGEVPIPVLKKMCGYPEQELAYLTNELRENNFISIDDETAVSKFNAAQIGSGKNPAVTDTGFYRNLVCTLIMENEYLSENYTHILYRNLFLLGKYREALVYILKHYQRTGHNRNVERNLELAKPFIETWQVISAELNDDDPAWEFWHETAKLAITSGKQNIRFQANEMMKDLCRNDPEKIFITKLFSSAYYIDTNDFIKARESLENLTIREINQFNDKRAEYYYLISRVALNDGNTRDANNYSGWSFEIAKKENDFELLLDLHYLRYRLFAIYTNDYTQANHELDEALKILEQHEDPIREGILYNGMALAHYDSFQLDWAEEFAKKASELLKSNGGWFYWSISMGLLGIINLRLMKYSAAEKYLNQSRNIRELMSDEAGVLRMESNLAWIAFICGDYDHAETSYADLLEKRKRTGNKIGIQNIYQSLGIIHYCRKNSGLSLRYFEDALTLSTEISSRESQIMISSYLLNINPTEENYLKLISLDSEKFILQHVRKMMSVVDYLLKTGQLEKLETELEKLTSAFDRAKFTDGFEQEYHYLKFRAMKKLGRPDQAISSLKDAFEDVMKKANGIKDWRKRELFLYKTELNIEIQKNYQDLIENHSDDEDIMLSAIYKIAQTINSILELDELLQTILEITTSNLNAEHAAIFLKKENGKDLDVVRVSKLESKTLVDARRIAHQIIYSAKMDDATFYSSNAKLDSRLQESISIKEFDISSILCVPLQLKSVKIGAIYVDSRLSNHMFDDRDKRFLEILANLASIAIENSRINAKLKTENRELQTQNVNLQLQVKKESNFENMVGQSSGMQKVFRLIEAAAKTDSSILIHGESGTGKEMVAKAIHYSGLRKSKPFLPVDCGSLGESLLESELFGHKKGSFTGASEDKKGLFEAATEGTLFLDEITNTTLSLQARLLRVLQEGEIRRVGETVYRKVDVRIIAATNLDIQELIRQEKFRQDLFYRLNVIAITLPPLRERKDDIPLIIQHILSAKLKPGDRRFVIGKNILDALTDYSWPGNIRELMNELEKLIAITGSTEPFSLSDLSTHILENKSPSGKQKTGNGISSDFNLADQVLEEVREKGLKQYLETVEAELIRKEIEKQNSNMSDVARSFKLANATLADKLKKYGLK